MSNHVHVIVKMDRATVMTWDAVEVIRRWLSIYPRKYLGDGTPVLPCDDELALLARNKPMVERLPRLAPQTPSNCWAYHNWVMVLSPAPPPLAGACFCANLAH